MTTIKPAKTKKVQPKTPEVTQLRDSFLTPRYGTELLIPYLKQFKNVWECASGTGRMANVIKENGHKVLETDIDGNKKYHNFLTDDPKYFINEIDIIVTNVPFSLKMEFMNKAFEINKPFAFLIPLDMSGFLWDCFRHRNLQCLVPERRIDYLTPNIVKRTNVGEGVRAVNKKYGLKENGKKWTEEDIRTTLNSDVIKVFNKNKTNFKSIDDIPVDTIKKYTSSDFHSFWVLWKFNLKENWNFIPLSNEDKKRIL